MTRGPKSIDPLKLQQSMALPTSLNNYSVMWKRCCSLARGIDQALARNNCPASAHRIPHLVKQLYSHLKDTSVRPAVALLMISVKNASNHGWFHGTEADEILKLANELLSSFCMNARFSADANAAVSTISNIISRFLPQLILNHLIICIEAKRGYDVLMADFYIEKALSPNEDIRLFVARNDRLLTSSCLISPYDANFLLNGKRVAGRTNVFLDSGPQVPTDITELVTRGANVIQAAGCFMDNYIIAVVSISKSSAAEVPNLKDYVQASVSTVVSDSDILEGPSRISLNCPLSFKRIDTPIKGHLCKHHQCFDYNNFLGLNFKKPSWHCPICNQTVSFLDIRIDQTMVKILRDTASNVNDVIIYPDGTCSSTEAQMHSQIESAKSASIIFDLTTEEDDTSHDTNFKTKDEIPMAINENGVSINSEIQNASLSTFDQELASKGSVLDMFESGSLFDSPIVRNENETQQSCIQRQECRTSGYPSKTCVMQNQQSQCLNLTRQQQMLNPPMNTSNAAAVSSSTFPDLPANNFTVMRRVEREDQQRHAQLGRAYHCSLPNNASDILGNETMEISKSVSWQPSGRMRGSLTGDAYSAAVNRYKSPH